MIIPVILKNKNRVSKPFISTLDTLLFEIQIGERCTNCEIFISLENLGKPRLCNKCLNDNKKIHTV